VIISRTPYRISFFGGGTDYPTWYRVHGGSALSATIDKYCYLTCRRLPPFFEHSIRVVYSAIEVCRTADEIKHPAAREVMKFVGVNRGIEIHHDGDLPARSGIGSSSAFTVGLLHSLYALTGVVPDRRRLALESVHIEQDLLRENVGSQDQVAAAYGGLNHIRFLPSGEIEVRPMTLSAERLGDLNAHLMLFFTGIQRTASAIASTFTDRLGRHERDLRTMMAMVDESISILAGSGDLMSFGRLLHEGWRVKRGLSTAVSNRRVEAMYAAAREAGAIGGKLAGAGGGGFLLLFAPPHRHAAIRERLRSSLRVPFAFEFSGSQIIFSTPDPDHSFEARERESNPIAPFRQVRAKAVRRRRARARSGST
jgi:D-glycero-alpha-D-manno-heptose-7-phosphate kinase